MGLEEFERILLEISVDDAAAQVVNNIDSRTGDFDIGKMWSSSTCFAFGGAVVTDPIRNGLDVPLGCHISNRIYLASACDHEV